jgi:RHS repeat-associated protein
VVLESSRAGSAEALTLCTVAEDIKGYAGRQVRVTPFFGAGAEQAALYDPKCRNGERVVSNAYNSAGQISRIANGEVTSSTSYANNIAYAPHGAISNLPFGNTVAEAWSYNARLQPTQIQAGSLLTLGYSYSATANSGNLASQTITRPGGIWTDTYSYDGFNRLNTAWESGTGSWSQYFGYDNFGNRWISSYSGLPALTLETPQSSSWYLANNRINGWTYDNAGNIQAMGSMPRTFSYDAESRQQSANINGTPTTYGYDGDGRRVIKTVGSQTTVFVYDAMGHLAAEYGPATDSGTNYLSVDHLGSTRLVMNSSGGVKRCYDYLPFGEQLYAGVGNRPSSCFDSVPPSGLLFTGQLRDSESGLDYFGARYFSSAQGRFTSPDVPLADQRERDPQSWNMYAYARNNPFRFFDPTGRKCVTVTVGGKDSQADDGTGGGCAAAGVDDKGNIKPHTVTVNAKPGNAVGAFALNFFFALDNAANAWFSPLTKAMGVTPSYMRDTPTSNDSTGKLAAGVEFLGEMALGPGEERAALKLIHSPETLSKTILEGLRKKSTQEIIETLKPGAEEALRVRPDGRVMNGNHRITVLMERGVNVNALPREIVK